ncbi:MAG: glucose-6-phosphate dehydrogenase, partial [Anaerolineales bacterium]
MADPTTLVIFGASGDLTRRKLVPALYHLQRKGRLPEGFSLLGVARHPMSDEAFQKAMEEAVAEFSSDPIDTAAWSTFRENLHYVAADPTQTDHLRTVEARLRELEAGSSTAHRLYYFAIPPEIYQPTLECLAEAGMVAEANGWRRVVIEKPFGQDLASARALNGVVHRVLHERQVYRIDHYLGKETVQNVLVFRFANSIFEPLWSRSYIDHVQITVAEEVGVAHRAKFYDSVGVVRDVFQNHLLQLLALVGMEPPASFDPEMVRNERSKLLSAVRPVAEAEVARHTARGQYRGYA